MLEEIPGTKIQLLNGENVDDIDSALQKVGVSPADYKAYLNSKGKSHVLDILKQDLLSQQLEEQRSNEAMTEINSLFRKHADHKVAMAHHLQGFDQMPVHMIDQFDKDQAELAGNMYRGIDEVVGSVAYHEPIDRAESQMTLKAYKDYLKDADTLKEWDEQVIRNNLYDDIIAEAHDQVIDAVSTRRKHQIPHVIEVFNRTIGQKVP